VRKGPVAEGRYNRVVFNCLTLVNEAGSKAVIKLTFRYVEVVVVFRKRLILTQRLDAMSTLLVGAEIPIPSVVSHDSTSNVSGQVVNAIGLITRAEL
jgi:hypothetical protein